MMITDKLTTAQQQSILGPLFGFEFMEVNDNPNNPHWVLYDAEGDEFYGSDANCQFDFSTLAGIFAYVAHDAKAQGYSQCQWDMKKVLGV